MHFNGHSNRHIKKLAKRLMTCRYGCGRVAPSRADVEKSKNTEIHAMDSTADSAQASC